VVEDQMMIAFELKEMLERMGCETVGPCRNLKAGLKAVAREKVDFAILDINLGAGENSAPIADALLEEKVPFVFLTAYSGSIALPDRFNEIGCYDKPVSSDDIGRAIYSAGA